MIAVDGAHILVDGTFRTGSMLTDKGAIAAVAWFADERRGLRDDEARALRDVADAHARLAERTAAIVPAIDGALRAVAAQFAAWLQPLPVA